MSLRSCTAASLTSGLSAIALCTAASAAPVTVKVTIENLAPANSVSFAPLRLGFNNGTFDAFNIGQVATAPIISVAEGGSGAAWLPAFAAADPGAVIGSIGGPLFPGQTREAFFTVDGTVNRFFTFGSMVIPSNDFFIGNDDATEYQIFDAAGNLQITSIEQSGRDIWDAGSEAFDPANAAFVVGGNNGLRTPQNGVVSFDFAELSGFNGLTTGAGYVFNSQLTADTGIYRISFQQVPEPSGYGLVTAGLFAAAWVSRRRKAGAATVAAVADAA